LTGSQGTDAVEAVRIIGERLQHGLDRRPHGVPRGAELAGQSVDGGVLSSQLLYRPLHYAGRGGVPRRGEAGKIFDEGAAFARRSRAHEAALAPNDRDGATERGDVDQAHYLPAMPYSDGAAVGASDRPRLGLNGNLQVLIDHARIKDVHVIETDENIAAGTTRRRCGAGGRLAAPDRLRHGSRPLRDWV
jgi:hypothetical protein